MNEAENKKEVKIQYMEEDEFKERLIQQFGEVYTREELEEKYIIESIAYGGMLCTRKDNDSMCVFMDIKSQTTQYFYKTGGI